MTKKKISKVKSLSLWIVIGLLGVVGIGTGILAYSGSGASTVVENCNNCTLNSSDPSGQLGGVNFENERFLQDVTFSNDLITNAGVSFNAGFVKGGSLLDASTTLTAARSITAAEVCDYKTITVNSAAVAGTIAAASLDLTLPATSTLFADCLDTEGDEVSFDFINQSPTAASTTEFVAGTGCSLVTGVADGDATIPGQKGATVTIKRLTDWLADGGTKDCVAWIYEWN